MKDNHSNKCAICGKESDDIILLRPADFNELMPLPFQPLVVCKGCLEAARDIFISKWIGFISKLSKTLPSDDEIKQYGIPAFSYPSADKDAICAMNDGIFTKGSATLRMYRLLKYIMPEVTTIHFPYGKQSPSRACDMMVVACMLEQWYTIQIDSDDMAYKRALYNLFKWLVERNIEYFRLDMDKDFSPLIKIRNKATNEVCDVIIQKDGFAYCEKDGRSVGDCYASDFKLDEHTLKLSFNYGINLSADFELVEMKFTRSEEEDASKKDEIKCDSCGTMIGNGTFSHEGKKIVTLCDNCKRGLFNLYANYLLKTISGLPLDTANISITEISPTGPLLEWMITDSIFPPAVLDCFKGLRVGVKSKLSLCTPTKKHIHTNDIRPLGSISLFIANGDREVSMDVYVLWNDISKDKYDLSSNKEMHTALVLALNDCFKP